MSVSLCTKVHVNVLVSVRLTHKYSLSSPGVQSPGWDQNTHQRGKNGGRQVLRGVWDSWRCRGPAGVRGGCVSGQHI